MSIVGVKLQRDLKGIRSIEMEFEDKRKSISITRTFEKGYTEFDQVKECIIAFTSLCAEKLRLQG